MTAEPLIPQPKILLEGTHLTRKTDVAFELAEHRDIIGHRRRRWHIPLVSAEWETRSNEPQTKSDPGWSMIDYPAEDEPWAMKSFEAYVRLLELNAQYYWILDRFHLSTVAFQRLERGRQVDLEWVDRRLAAAGFVLVHLRRDPDSFPAAREHRLTYSENPHRYSDLSKFVREQDILAELAAGSRLPSTEIDVTSGDIPLIASRILAWVREIGAFYPSLPTPLS